MKFISDLQSSLVMISLWLVTCLVVGACCPGVGVVNTIPKDDEGVAVTSWVGIEFQRSMQRSSVEDRFHIEPDVIGELIWDDTKLWLRPAEPLDPGQEYTAYLEPGALAQDGDWIKDQILWTFRVREPDLVYLIDEHGHSTVVAYEIGSGQSIQLTSGIDVSEFVPSRDGNMLALIIHNGNGGGDIWLMDRDGSNLYKLVNCGPDRCSSPSWSPSGNRIAYSREIAATASSSGFDPPRLWTVDIETEGTSELIHDDHILLGQPSWSPDGRWLAFYDQALDGIRMLDLWTSSEQILPTGFGLIGSWSPDGRRMVYPVLIPQDEQFMIGIQVADLLTKETTFLIDEGKGWEDVSQPRWSPSGDWIAIGALSAEHGPSRQLWLVKPDGSQALSVSEDPDCIYGGYHWDPWGKRLVLQRIPVGDPDVHPDVVLWEFDGAFRIIARNAWLPDWLP